jgi:hypothetical protein
MHRCDNFLGHSLGLGCLTRWILELLAGSYMTKKNNFLELAGFQGYFQQTRWIFIICYYRDVGFWDPALGYHMYDCETVME